MMLAFVACAAHAADVYKWVDAGGVVHYSDTEPARGIKSERLHLTGTAATASNDAATPQPDDSAASPGDAPAVDKTLVSAAQSAEKRCATARENLEVLQGNSPVGLDTGGSGQARVLDDAGRKAQIAAAQTLIATYCK
jgi:hypothetical protein